MEDHLKSVSDIDAKNPNSLLANLYYCGKIGSWGIDANFDYYSLSDKKNDRVGETSVRDTRTVESVTENSNHLFAARLVADRALWLGNLKLGGELTAVRRSNEYAISGVETMGGRTSNVREQTYAAFADYGLMIPRAGMLTLGIRYEHVNLRFNDFIVKKVTREGSRVTFWYLECFLLMSCYRGLVGFGEGVVDGTVYVVVEWLCGAEDFGEAMGETWGSNEVIVNVGNEAVVFQAHKVGVRGICRVAFGHFLQCTVHVDGESAVGSFEHLFGELFPAFADVFAENRDYGRIVAVVARRKHVGVRVGVAFAGAEVEVVACVHRLLSAWAEEYPEVGFIWSLVG